MIIFLVVFIDWAKNMTRVANSNNVGRNVFRDDAACADHGIVTDSNAGNNNDSCTKPAISTNMDWKIVQTSHAMFLLRQKSRIVWIINFLAVKKAVTYRKTLLYFS